MIFKINKVTATCFFISLFFPIVYWSGWYAVPLWLLPLTVLLPIQTFISSRKNNVSFAKLKAYDLWVILFVLSMVLSSWVNGVYGRLGVNKQFLYSICVLLTIYVRHNSDNIFNPSYIERFTYVFIGVQAILCVVQSATGSPFGNLGAYLGTTQSNNLQSLGNVFRVTGSLGGSGNNLGRVTAVLVPFLFISYFRKKHIRSVLQSKNASYIETLTEMSSRTRLFTLGWAVFFSSLAVLIFLTTLSRSSILVFGLAIGTIFYLNWYHNNSNIKSRSQYLSKIFLLITVTFFFTLYIAYINDSFKSKYYSSFAERWESVQRLTEGKLEAGMLRRLIMFQESVEMFQESPIVGKGFYNTRKIASRTGNPVISRMRLRTHGAYIEYLASFGLIGFTMFLVVTLYPVYASLNLIRQSYVYIPLLLSNISIVVIMQFGTTYTTASVAPVYAMIWGSTMGIYYQLR